MSGNEHCESGFISNSPKDIFWYLGFILFFVIACRFILSVWRGLYTCILANLFGVTVNWKELKGWAVVTGATDGIGKSYAKAFAEKGFNIVLISRTEEKLKTVALEIGQKFQVKTQIIAVDFTDDSKIYDKIGLSIKDLEIGVLVNNVGMSYEHAEYLTKVKDGETFADKLIKANIISVTRMTQLILPQMEQRRNGVIINISSLSALSPVPLLSMYSAGKAYVNYFTRATQEEYKKKGVIIQSVLPGFVSTKMSMMRPSLKTCTPDAFVKWALKTVGVEDKTYGYPMHKVHGYLQELLVQYLPESLGLAIAHNMMSGMRKKYYKKYGLKDNFE